jgi:hypothetical protein
MSSRRNVPVHYVRAPQPAMIADPATLAELEQWRLAATDPAALIRQQQRNSELYLRWKIRQADIKERDRKFRRFWLGFGAVFGLGLLIVVFIAGWLLWTAAGLGVLTVPVVLVVAGGLAVGGHRCITIVQHMH